MRVSLIVRLELVMISTLLPTTILTEAVDGDTPDANTSSNQEIPDLVIEV